MITLRFEHMKIPEEEEDLKNKLDNPGYFCITSPPTNQSRWHSHGHQIYYNQFSEY